MTMTSALEREFKLLMQEQGRIKTALANVELLEKWLSYIEMKVAPISSIYSSGYAQYMSVTLEPRSVDSFNDLADHLDGLTTLLNIDVNRVTSIDMPEDRCREFTLRGQYEGIEIEYTLRAYLKDDSRCQIIVEREEEITTERWVKVTERKPVLRFICPED